MKQQTGSEYTAPSLKDKIVVIIGGSSGIGLAIAQAAAAEGANVIIASGKKERVDNALRALPAGCTGHTVNVTDEQQLSSFFRQIGHIDHLAYTAGEHLQLGNIDDTNIADAKAFFNVRYWGAYMTVKHAAPLMNAGGSISLTSGIAALRPNKGWSLGASICAAMEGFTRAMAVELAPIRVNIVSPGFVRTNLWNNFPEAEREGMFTSVGNSLLVKRVGEANDIALTFLYLMKQQFGTGQVVVADGGGILV